MKMFFLCIFSISIFCFIDCDNKNEIKNIKISYIDWDIDSPIRIECNDLKNYIQSLAIINASEGTFCRSIERELKAIKEIEITNEPDVRIRLDILFQNDLESVLCIGNNKVLEYNGKIVKYNNNLISIIREYIDNKD